MSEQSTANAPTPPDPLPLEELDRAIDAKRLELQKLFIEKWQRTGQEPVPGAPYLPAELLYGATLLPDREYALRCMKGCQRIMEVSTWAGTFARRMLEVIAPRELHILDIDFSRLDRDWFAPRLDQDVFLHEGDSAKLMERFEDDSFDFIYIDGDHSYGGASRDLAVAYRKVRPGGFIGMNDYATWCASLVMEFGVMRATNEFILEKRTPVRYFALHHNGNHDVYLQKL